MGALKLIGTVLLFAVAALALAITVVPQFLDRIYYRGPTTDHFDGGRFSNPDGDDTFRAPGGRSRGGFLLRYLTGADGRPPWPERVRVATSKPAARVDGETMVATWIGHATVLVQSGGLNILTDPIWSDRTGPFARGPKRVAQPGVAFDDLPRIDLVVISHNHYDHLDLPTLKRLWDRDRPTIVTGLGNDTILRAAGIGRDLPQRLIALDWGRRITISATCIADGPCPAPIDVTVTRNHHWGSRWFADRNRALWSSFVVHLPGGNFFFAGDTGLGNGSWADEAAALGPIRLAAVPIGAFRFSPGEMVTGSHVGPVDAVEIYRRLGAQHGLPIHWGTFRLSYESYDTPPRLLAAAVACTGQTGFAAHALGVPWQVRAFRAPTQPPAPATKREALIRCLDTPAVRALK